MCWKAIAMFFGNALGSYRAPGGVAVAPTPTPTPTPSPTFSVQPSITGTATVGNALSSLTYHDGTVLNGSITTRTILLAGVAKLSTYVLVTGDIGASVTYEVDATGTGGSASATSAGVTVVAAGALSAPVLTKTSAAGEPLAFTIAVDETVAVGMYWHLQLAGASNFTTPLTGEGAIREVTQSIVADDFIIGPLFSILAGQPSGPIYARLYVESDEPATSAASNVLSDTVT